MSPEFIEYIKKNKEAYEFVAKYPDFTASAFKKFEEWYWDESKFDGKGGGSKFSERVFSFWIYNFLNSNNTSFEIKPQSKFPLVIDGVTKQVDLHLLTNNGSSLIEFKCNIDMIEKDIFKFIYSDLEANKIIFIWEVCDNSKAANGEDSSYLKILKHFKSVSNINYFYFPLMDRKKEYYRSNIVISKEIAEFKKYLQSL